MDDLVETGLVERWQEADGCVCYRVSNKDLTPQQMREYADLKQFANEIEKDLASLSISVLPELLQTFVNGHLAASGQGPMSEYFYLKRWENESDRIQMEVRELECEEAVNRFLNGRPYAHFLSDHKSWRSDVYDQIKSALVKLGVEVALPKYSDDEFRLFKILDDVEPALGKAGIEVASACIDWIDADFHCIFLVKNNLSGTPETSGSDD